MKIEISRPNLIDTISILYVWSENMAEIDPTESNHIRDLIQDLESQLHDSKEV